MNFEKWVNEFEAYLRATGISNKRDALLAFLDGECVKLLSYVNANPYEPQAYEQIKSILRQIFGSRQKSPADKINEFYARTQITDENARLFMAELTALAYEAFPQVQNRDLKEIISCQFTRGLKGTRMRDRIQHDQVRDPDILLESTIRAKGQLEAMQAGFIAGQCGIQNAIGENTYWCTPPSSPQTPAQQHNAQQSTHQNVSLVDSMLSSTPTPNTRQQQGNSSQRDRFNDRNQSNVNSTPTSTNARPPANSSINA